MVVSMKVKCDRPYHDGGCPAWCDLRPGGATKECPASENKATTLFPDDYANVE